MGKTRARCRSDPKIVTNSNEIVFEDFGRILVRRYTLLTASVWNGDSGRGPGERRVGTGARASQVVLYRYPSVDDQRRDNAVILYINNLSTNKGKIIYCRH